MTVKYPQEFHRTSFPLKGVLHVEINRPQKLNAMHQGAYLEYGLIMELAGTDPEVRVVVLNGVGRAFCAGLDVMGASSDFMELNDLEKSRGAIRLVTMIRKFQAAIGQSHKLNKPVIGVAHGPSIGLAIDILCTVDVRFAAKDALFSVREIDIGMPADIGTLQRLPRLVGSLGWVKDVCYTGRNFDALEAKEQGFVQGVFDTKEAALKHALEYAEILVAKSPVAMWGTKQSINYALDHTLDDSLDQIASFNGFGLGQDFTEGCMAMLSKDKPQFEKL